MSVDSPLDLFLTLYAWKQYENVWLLLSMSGLVFLPIAWIFVENSLKAIKQAATFSEAAVASVPAMRTDIGIALGVWVLAFYPLLTINPTMLRYQHPCDPKATEQKPGASGTTWDKAFSADTQDAVHIPVWWRLTLAVSNGLNRALITGAGCTVDVALLHQEVERVQITDPELMHQLRRFEGECYQRAYAHYMDHQAEFPPEKIKQLQEESHQGVNDTQWIGSLILRGLGLYKRFYAKTPVPGFPIDPSRETDKALLEVAQTYSASPPQWGVPNCEDWFSQPGTTAGLFTRLLALYPPAVVESILALVTSKTDQEIKEELVARLGGTQRAAPNTGSFTGFSYNQGTDYATLKGLFASAGLWLEGLSQSPRMYAIKEALPMVKALLLMGAVICIPLILLFSGYRLEAVFMITVGLIGINFLSVIWHIAWLLENSMIQALWPEGTDYVIRRFGGHSIAVKDSELEFKQDVLEFVLMLSYLFLPAIFLMALGWAGVKVFAGVSGIIGAITEPVGQAGRQAADIAKSTALSIGSKALTKKKEKD